MQNISYVLSLLGREWLPGLAPATNVGANVGAKIEQLIAEVEGKKIVPTVFEALQVRERLSAKALPRPMGALHPVSESTEVSSFQRDASVKAWVLQRAKGKCECCECDAPFTDSSGKPYLEVHHVRQLADGGSDRISNAVAICPNCHREIHYGQGSAALRERLYARITELIRESAK